MDKTNKEIIKAKQRLIEIEELKKSLDEEYQLLSDKIHLYFDSPNLDTTEAEKFIISYFWQNAYKEYSDGGYITNDEFISDVRFRYECELMRKIIDENCDKKARALDIGCGNGRYTKFLASIFDEVVGADLSKPRIEDNINENKLKNVKFICENVMSLEIDKFDFVFASDMQTYTNDNETQKVFENLQNLLKDKKSILLTRESTRETGDEYFKSRKYIAYYRNWTYYTENFFKPYIIKTYKNYGYNMYHLNKFFNVKKEAKAKVHKNPMLLEKIVKKHIDPFQRSGHFYVYRA